MISRSSRFMVELPYFIVVAEELHFGRAAERLGMSQPPLGRRIHMLEKEVGVELFSRSKHHVALTDAGKELLRSARKIIHDSERAIQDVNRTAKGLAGRLNIGFVSSALYSLLPPAVLEFGRLHPNVELSLLEMTTVSQIIQLQQQELDVGFLRSPGSDQSLKIVPALKEPLVCIVHKSHPLAGKLSISVKELANERFIMYSRYNIPRLRDVLFRLCGRFGFEPNVVQDANQIPTIIAFVSAGLGVALVPTSSKQCLTGAAVSVALKETVMVELDIAKLRRNSSSLVDSFIEVVCAVGLKLEGQYSAKRFNRKSKK